ncbi:MAG: hypothetical protein AAFV33_02450 [Chloroflexota bacterium]
MSREQLDRAYDLITREKYEEARDILVDLKDRSSTARRWLANVNDMLGIDAESVEVETGSMQQQSTPDEETFRDRITEAVVDGEMELDAAAAQTDFVEPVDTFDAVDEPTDAMPPQPEMDAAIPVADDDMPAATTDDELMPIDETADVLPTDNVTLDDGSMRWEYREIVVKTWQQHIDNIEYALSEGGEKITIEDAYTKLLNESGEQGWELVSEQILPQQYVRLLLKRMVRS